LEHLRDSLDGLVHGVDAGPLDLCESTEIEVEVGEVHVEVVPAVFEREACAGQVGFGGRVGTANGGCIAKVEIGEQELDASGDGMVVGLTGVGAVEGRAHRGVDLGQRAHLCVELRGQLWNTTRKEARKRNSVGGIGPHRGSALVWVRQRSTYIYIYIYIHTYVCVCVCVCVSREMSMYTGERAHARLRTHDGYGRMKASVALL